jgi:hypothetical protein
MDFRSRAFSLTTLVLLANALLVLLSDFLTTFSGQAGFSIWVILFHRLKMEVDFQSLFGLNVT